jgi:DNA-binding MarR family transcriptional regulator
LTSDREHICEQLQDLLKQISMVLSYILSKVLEDSALTFHQVYVMKIIGAKTDVNLTSLCKELNLSKGAMSLTVNRLEEEGYVKKCENPSDRRNRNIVLTPKGEEVLNSTREKLREAFDKLTKDLTIEELENIKNSLMRLNETMCGAMKQYHVYQEQK